jgi:hypothetical protein
MSNIQKDLEEVSVGKGIFFKYLISFPVILGQS